jgi:lipopolysaccharide biosynthesis protein
MFSKVSVRSAEDNLVFIKAWNEWGEGNYLEPDLKYGTQFLDVIRDVLEKVK